MSQSPPLTFRLDTPCLAMSVKESVWDTIVYGRPVLQVTDIQVNNSESARESYLQYQEWRNQEKVSLVSCRLAHNRLRESMFLEEHDFRFIEMVLHPRFDLLEAEEFPPDTLSVVLAEEGDMNSIQAIAETAFGYERLHVDPRLSPRLGDKRYGRWVRTSLHHNCQRLYKILDGPRLVAFFILEVQSDSTAYWHLTAVAPQWQGQGYGRRVWQSMLSRHKEEGLKSVATTISARNTPVLNLYSQLRFRFSPPEMTFHWILEEA